MSWRPQVRGFLSRNILIPIATAIARTGISPDLLTILGFLLSLLAGYLLAKGIFVAGGIAVLLSGALDLLDGAVARVKGKASVRGAFLDSALDRLAEGAILGGLLWFYLKSDRDIEGLLVYLAFFMSVMVSYLRARAEGLGIPGDVGILSRGERILLLTAGLLLGLVPVALVAMVILGMVTVVQRLAYGLRKSQQIK